MKKTISALILLLACITASAQVVLDNATIEDIVKNERNYFNDITEIYRNDDPLLRIDDIALVYYGQAFLPQYKPGSDENEKELKKLFDENKHQQVYELAKNVLTYNPVSLNALFCIYIASKELDKSEEECASYLKKYNGIIDMILWRRQEQRHSLPHHNPRRPGLHHIWQAADRASAIAETRH